jgi:hypothetical protein
MNILITGGSGMIGTEISRQLLAKGHLVSYLSRAPKKNQLSIPEYKWDTDIGEIDTDAFKNIDAIINLAGASISERWTPEYKSEILRSRVDGTRLLFETIEKLSTSLKAFVSASAVGYYPNSLSTEFTEADAPGTDFLSLVCQKWEQEAHRFELLGIRTVRLRIGIVLSAKGGALSQIAKPVKFGLGAPLGSGKQWMPWIHLYDLASMFVKAVEDDALKGAYNASGLYNVSNAELTKQCASVLGRPYFMPNIPASFIKLLLGEMADIALASNKVSSLKIQNTGFEFKYDKLDKALQDLLK